MSENAITVENLSKVYRIGQKQERADSFVSGAVGALRRPFQNWARLRRLDVKAPREGEDEDLLWALRDVSFSVAQGDVLGVIGRNGAGKSTLLKVLSRITEPTRGRITIRGRISSLLEVGTGFHPELTGRENVYVNGTILGMSKREIDRKFDEIVVFSGISRFLDTPVKRYSSGMQVRLAFSVAAHLEPEILIIDEVLAVGDAQFQRKCLAKMREVAQSGHTVIFVSHNLAAVRQLCHRGILLQAGQVVLNDDVEPVLNRYCAEGDAAARVAVADRLDRAGSGEALLREVVISGENGLDLLQTGQGASFQFQMVAEQPLRAGCTFTIYDDLGTAVAGFTSPKIDPESWAPTPQGQVEASVKCDIEQVPLVPGSYSLNVAITGQRGLCDHLDHAVTFNVVEGFEPFGLTVRHWVGQVLIPHGWSCVGALEATV